jgi:DeoR/GlpR family transcriptional regulator of sugar metabolism
MTFSYEDLAKYYGVSRTTFKRHLHKLVESKQFKKTAKGRFFNEPDAVKIASLLGFKITIIEKSTPGASEAPQKKDFISPNQIDLVESIKEVEQEQKNKFKFK